MINFSVLLSVYSKEQPVFLEQSLSSILNQTLIPAEIVLVKDGPLTRELDYVVKRYQDEAPIIKVIQLPQNQGLGKALNEGLKHCSHELVARMDTDDIAKPNRFERQMQVFEEHPEVDIVSAWIEEFEDEVDNVVSIRKLPETHAELYSYAKLRCPINHPVAMFKKSAVLAAGSYQHFPLFEDYYLWVRMLMNGAKFYNIQESLLYFRFSPDMFKRRGGWKYAKDELRFQKMLYERGFISRKEFVKNSFIRFTARVIPNKLRAWVYKKLLR